MTNLNAIQERLNHDARDRADFFSDPVSFLKKEGLTLPKSAEKGLEKLVAETRLKKNPFR